MPPAQRPAQTTRHKYFVTRFPSVPADPTSLLDEAGHTHRNYRGTFDAARLAADDRDVECPRRFFQATINLPDPMERALRRNNHRDERKPRHAGHRGKIA